MSKKITFDEIQAGDRIRVTYQTALTAGVGPSSMNDVVTRSIASTAVELCMDRVWLNEGAHPIAHKDWLKMNIYRLDSLSSVG